MYLLWKVIATVRQSWWFNNFEEELEEQQFFKAYNTALLWYSCKKQCLGNKYNKILSSEQYRSSLTESRLINPIWVQSVLRADLTFHEFHRNVQKPEQEQLRD